MIFATSLPGFKVFLGNAAQECADFPHCVAFVCCILLPVVARRSVKAASRAVRSELRDAGNLLRFLGGSSSPNALLFAAQDRLLDEARRRAECLHLLLIDSTQHGQEGLHTQNTCSCRNTTPRPKKSSRKQKKTQKRSCHCFVFALLLTPRGLRIPYWLPFYTKEHCEIRNWKHRTQADLAAQLITQITLPSSVPLVVVGDTAFEAKQIRAACAKRNAHWVVPINPERRLATAEPRPSVLSLCETLGAADFRCVSFRLDEGELAPMARVSPSRVRSSKHQRVYRVHQRIAEVHSVGKVVLLFSNKQDPNKTQALKVQKVLMSDAREATAEQLLRWYALRWQIEQFFKEMKSELGMCQYKTKDFARVVGWVNLCVLSFCYLEWTRGARLSRASKKERPYWRAARTHALRQQLRQQAEQADVRELIRIAAMKGGGKRLTDLLHAGYDDPAAHEVRQGVA